jgi:hypothetical protein
VLVAALGGLGFWLRGNARTAGLTTPAALPAVTRSASSPRRGRWSKLRRAMAKTRRRWCRVIVATENGPVVPARRRLLLLALPPILAVLGLCTVNLAAHGRFAISPFGNVFLLARVIYDGPGMATLRRDCPSVHWRLCPFLDRLPMTSDEFLWSAGSPLYLAGGPKIVSLEAGSIIQTAVLSDPAGEARAALGNMLEQLRRFDSGDGLESWPGQVTPWIELDLPASEHASYASARQQTGRLSVPEFLTDLHLITALAGVAGSIFLLPFALRRRAACAGFLLAVLLALPVSAAITGGLSAPHDRYQSRIMWLPPFIAVVSLMSLRRRHE